jgi:hypothetical protein
MRPETAANPPEMKNSPGPLPPTANFRGNTVRSARSWRQVRYRRSIGNRGDCYLEAALLGGSDPGARTV